ncbi:MAG TPA: hypothetical protein VKV73_01660 [Chloroflexota bacterium]|nr:hypothetical protein [Chloroflexota bacterium]
MWRTYVICVLIGLLLVSTGGSVLLERQVLSAQADADRLRQRVAAAESAQAKLQQQLDQLKVATPGARPTPGAPATLVPNPSSATVPNFRVGGADTATLQLIEDEVSGLRGLQPRTQVPLRFLDQPALQQYFVDRFNQDYLPSERESDQKLLATLGLISSTDSVTQILLDVLQEQVIGVYNPDDKVMYLVTSDNGQFGPEEKDTFAHEYTHALQDQYFDLTALEPKHPPNDDRSLAVLALSEGDAVLMQRLWAQEKLSQDEINQLGQGGADSKLFSAPAFLRDQLLFPYSDGFNFVRQIYQAGGGYAGVDDVFRDPPDSTAQILHPEKYRGHVKPVDVSLPDLSAGSLGDGWRKINSNVLGELDIRLILSQLTDSSHGVRGSGGWSGDRWELLEKAGRQALVIESVWDTPDDANNFFQTWGLAMQNRFHTATPEESSATRQALTTPTAATDLRRTGQTVLAVISFDRPSADAIATAVAP